MSLLKILFIKIYDDLNIPLSKPLEDSTPRYFLHIAKCLFVYQGSNCKFVGRYTDCYFAMTFNSELAYFHTYVITNMMKDRMA